MATASAALVIEMMIAAAIARPAHGPSTAVIASAATRSEDATRAGPSAARYPRLASRYTTMMPAVPRPMAMGRDRRGFDASPAEKVTYCQPSYAQSTEIIAVPAADTIAMDPVSAG